MLTATAVLTSPATTRAAPDGVEPVQLRWCTIDGGGGRLTAGSIELHATMGQSDVDPNAQLGQGGLRLRSGYWSSLGQSLPLFNDGFESN